jgi:hypothetical protein
MALLLFAAVAAVRVPKMASCKLEASALKEPAPGLRYQLQEIKTHFWVVE